MKLSRYLIFGRIIGLTAPACLILLIAAGLPAYGQMTPMPTATPTPKMPDKMPDMTPAKTPAKIGDKAMDKMPDKTADKPDDMNGMEEEVPHPFFTHDGLPDEVGTFMLRTSAEVVGIDGQTKGDFGFHLETGLTSRLGIHIRNDRFLNSDHTEVMFQYAVFKSKDGKNGFAPILEFEFPTRRGASPRINVLFGFSTKFSNSKAAFNTVFHYDPRAKMVETNMSFVFEAAPRLYPVVEVLAEAGPGMGPIASVIAGFKVRITRRWLIGFGYQAPITTNKDFSAVGVFQSENMFMRKH